MNAYAPTPDKTPPSFDVRSTPAGWMVTRRAFYTGPAVDVAGPFPTRRAAVDAARAALAKVQP